MLLYVERLKSPGGHDTVVTRDVSVTLFTKVGLVTHVSHAKVDVFTIFSNDCFFHFHIFPTSKARSAFIIIITVEPG